MVLKGKMKEKGVVYAELAALLGITPTTFSQKVNGKSDFTISEAELIKSYLGADNLIFSE
jgi:putative transcriptional regulator